MKAFVLLLLVLFTPATVAADCRWLMKSVSKGSGANSPSINSSLVIRAFETRQACENAFDTHANELVTTLKTMYVTAKKQASTEIRADGKDDDPEAKVTITLGCELVRREFQSQSDAELSGGR